MKVAVTPLIAALAGLSCTAPQEQLSTAEKYNQQLADRRPAAPAPEPPPSDGFARSFRRTYGSVLSFGDGESPTRCAVGPDGSVYLAARRSGAVYAWTPGSNRLRRFPTDGGERAHLPTALAWSGADHLLYILDQGTNRVLKYRPDGSFAGDIPLNAGQSGFALDVLEDGSILVGGERWESDGLVTLLALYDADGRFRGSALPMDTAVVDGRMHLHTPVLLARADGQTTYVAEPTSYRWMRVGADGRILRQGGVEPQGYSAPTALPPELPPLPEMEVWRASWTPQLFLHSAGGLVFSGFEMRRPYHGYALDVYTAEGERVATGLLSQARPTCGRDTSLVFLRDAGPGRLEVRAYEYVGATARRTG